MPDNIMNQSEEAAGVIVQGPRQRSAQWGDLMTALAKAQGEIEGAKKDSQNPHFKSSYADLASVWAAIREPLSKNGLALTQWPRVVNGAVEVETILAHGEQFISDVLWMPCSKMDAHGIGSATTYARRYALMAIAGVAPEDDDGNGAVDGHKPGAAGTASGGTQFRPARRSPGMAQTESLRVDPADRDMVQGDGRKQYEVDKAKKAAASINTPAAAGSAIKRIEWVKTSIAYLADKDEHVARDWWAENKERIAVIETALPTEYERLLDTYNEAIERKVPA
jgi:hypothetical protein